MTIARRIWFCEDSARLEQRIARAWRKHQTRPVTVINLVAENTLEHAMLEKKAWGSSATAKSTQAVFLCLAHNLMVLLEENLLKVERIENAAERKRKDGRKEQAEKNGANYVAIALQRVTVRTLKFIRWLRNFVYPATSWEAALARLRHVYATF